MPVTRDYYSDRDILTLVSTIKFDDDYSQVRVIVRCSMRAASVVGFDVVCRLKHVKVVTRETISCRRPLLACPRMLLL